MKNYDKEQKKAKKDSKTKWFYFAVFACLIAIGGTGYLTARKASERTDAESLGRAASAPVLINDDAAAETEKALSDIKAKAESMANSAESAKEPEKEEQTPAAVYEKEEYIFPIEGGRLITPYSDEVPVMNNVMGDYRMHVGVDIAASADTDVLCPADGKVESVYNDEIKGITAVISHKDGVKSIICGLAEGVYAIEGTEIKQGAKVGKVGTTAYFESDMEPHIHYEMIKNGENLDPAEMLGK